MRRAAAVFVIAMSIVALTACTMWPEHKHKEWHDATDAASLDRLFWEDVAAKRWSQVSAHIAPLAVFKDGDESLTGPGPVIERLKAANISAVQVGEEESQPAGADLVTTYVLSIPGRPPIKALTVWQHVGKSWVIVAHSSAITLK